MEQTRALARGHYAKMTETVHIRHQASRFPMENGAVPKSASMSPGSALRSTSERGDFEDPALPDGEGDPAADDAGHSADARRFRGAWNMEAPLRGTLEKPVMRMLLETQDASDRTTNPMTT